MKGISVLITDLLLTLIVLSVFSVVLTTVFRNVNAIQKYSSAMGNVTLGSCFVALIIKGERKSSLILASTVNKTQLLTMYSLSSNNMKPIAKIKLKPYEVKVIKVEGGEAVVLVSSLGYSLRPKEVVTG